MYYICNFFFSDELRKFTISDFPKQTNFGHILITLFFFFTILSIHTLTLFFSQQPELVQLAQKKFGEAWID